MKRSWYQTSKLCTALRKHVLRVDLCVFIDEEKAFADENYLNSTIKSILTAAIIKGLDIIGILTPTNSSIGWKAVQMAKDQQMDITVVPGQTYICQEGTELYIYNMQQPLKLNLTFAEACRTAHSYNGFVVASNITKRQALLFDKLQGSDSAPDAVEIFNSKIGGYRDLNIDFPKFVSSGATSATDLENTDVFTLLDRKTAEEMNLLRAEEGINFVPKYLKPKSGGLTNGQSIL
jgi:hypothetical protein